MATPPKLRDPEAVKAVLANGMTDPERFVVEGKGEAELLAAFATPIPVIVICDLLGVPTGMAQQLLAWSHDMVAMYQARRDRAVEDRAAKATVDFSSFMRGYIGYPPSQGQWFRTGDAATGAGPRPCWPR